MEDDEIQEGRKATSCSTVAYEWSIRRENVNETMLVKVRCSAAASRSVPFPERWRTALRCYKLSSIAEASVQKAREEFGFSDLGCRVLGKPQDQVVPQANATCLPGSTVVLQTEDGERLEIGRAHV